MQDTDRRTPRVLVVEDEFLVAMDLAGFVRRLGFEPIIAARLDEALDTLSRSAGSFDAALVDINLGGDRSWSIARELGKRDVPFAFLTGYEADHADIPEDLRGAPVWPKPIGFDQLRSGIRQLAKDCLQA